ncbi:MAG: hypothetical protein A3J38_09375 [Gammaproteobacteria bacterium RIFCSPHIGHO2_12_FULL_45_9]|nr:MAG: hypothetical protein A3J38_09375 [Gammaproteobacteria bacterium RIFCSPHIGHO2_12_FULL_45_9]
MANNTSQELAFKLNAFYRDRYRRVMKFVSVMAVICAVLACILSWMAYDKKQPPYYAAMTTGEVVPMHALSEPVVTSPFIVAWSARTVQLIYNLNFSIYQKQLAAVQNRFTEAGWEKMMSALKTSGLLKTLVGDKLIITAVVSGTPVILAQMITDGRFTWRVQMKVLVTYTSASQTKQNEFVVTMNIQRVPTLDAANGIQIVSFET